MKTITVHKADPTVDPIEGIMLSITRDIPEGDMTERANIDLFASDATQIVSALHHLPGGTLDRVLVKLMESRVSSLRVPLVDFCEGPEGDEGRAAFGEWVQRFINQRDDT